MAPEEQIGDGMKAQEHILNHFRSLGYQFSLIDRKRQQRRRAKRALRTLREFAGRRPTGKPAINGERPIATNRNAQRQLERWVMRTGIWRLGKLLGLFSPKTHTIVDLRKDGGLDFGVVSLYGTGIAFRIDAKSEFKTTKPQDKQIAESWKQGIRCFLLRYRDYLEVTRNTKRDDNGSIWG